MQITYSSRLKSQDITFLKNIISDIASELCGCDCCKKENGCSIFERMYIAGNLLYKYIDYDIEFDKLYDSNNDEITAIYDSHGQAYTFFSLTKPDDVSYTELVVGTDVCHEDGTPYTSNEIFDKDGNDLYNTTIYCVSAFDFCDIGMNLFTDESCIDWNTISQRINIESAKKNKFVDRSRNKVLSRFYKYIYDFISSKPSKKIDAESSDYCTIDLSVFGGEDEAKNIIENCLDECCN